MRGHMNVHVRLKEFIEDKVRIGEVCDGAVFRQPSHGDRCVKHERHQRRPYSIISLICSAVSDGKSDRFLNSRMA